MRIFKSLFFLAVVSFIFYNVYNNYQEQKRRERLLCLLIMDRLGLNHNDPTCVEYEEEWKNEKVD